MIHWNYKAKHSHSLSMGRFVLHVVQTRGDGPPSPWWVTLDGVGSDPATNKPPAIEFDGGLNETEARAAALAWGMPLIESVLSVQNKAVREGAALLAMLQRNS